MNQRTKYLLLALAGVLLVWVLMSLGGGDGAPGPADGADGADGAAPAPTRTGGRAGTVGSGEREVLPLRSAVLEEVPPEIEPGRNPFGFYQPPPPPPPPRREVTPPQRRPEPPAVQQPPRRVEPPKPQPPPVTYRFLGSFGSERRKIAVLTDGELIVNAQVGDVLDGKFRISRIGLESVDIAFVDFPEAPPERLPVGQ